MKTVVRIILLLNYLSVASLLTSYLSPFLSPEHFAFIAFFGLAYPVLLLINIAFMVYWLLRREKKFLLSLIAILAGWFMIGNYLNVNFIGNSNRSKKIKIMSYNVHSFDLYKHPGNTLSRNKMFELIKDNAAQIICLQEFYANDLNTFNTLDTLIQFQSAKNIHVEYTTTVLEKHHFGIATFTTYPIVSKGRVEFSSERMNACIYTDIKINADTIRVYNMHLQSIHLSTVKYKDPHIRFETEEIYEHDPKNIFRHLSTAFRKRAAQADAIAQHISQCPYPVVVSGDFNDTPSSYTYRKIKGSLADAFIESGGGLGTTYAGKIPFLRIDYILHSPSLVASDFKIIEEKVSDHYPICCAVEIVGDKR